jgi:replicative DNA helicase
MGDDKTGHTKARVLEVGGAELVKARAELRELDLDAEGKLDELVPDLAKERREKRAEVANLEKLLAPTRPKRLGELLEPAFKRFRARVTGDESPVPLPWPALAALYGGGLWPGVHIMGGGTGVGKTAFVLQMALHAAREGVPVLYIGLEMGEMDAVARCVALLNAASPDVHASELMHGKWAGGGGVNVTRLGSLEGTATHELGDLPFELEAGDAHGWSYMQLVPRVADLRARYDVAAGAPVLVVLDFLQLVDSPKDARREELRERITRASYQAREAVRHHNAAVLMVSSTSRENERALRQWGDGWPAEPVTVTVGKGTNELWCSSFIGIGKESGDIEYSAESLTVLARVGPGPGRTTRVRVGVPKTRYGASGRHTTLLFNGSRWLDDDDTGEKADAAAAALSEDEKKKAAKKAADAERKRKAEEAKAAKATARGSVAADFRQPKEDD